MSSPSRGKLLREDYSNRTADWPSIPKDLYWLYSVDNSSSVVCRNCHRPSGGLRFDAAEGNFVHSDEIECTNNRFSQR